MKTPITAEGVFAKHAEAHALPKFSTDDSIEDYIEKHGNTDEAERCLLGAATAAGVADHTACAHWCAQARQHILPPAKTDRRG